MLQLIRRFLGQAARRRRAALVLASALAGLAIGATWSRSYWGYAFVRPRPDGRILSAIEVTGRSSLVGTPEGLECGFHLGPVEPKVTGAAEDPYYNPGARVLQALRHRNIELDSVRAVMTPSADALGNLLRPLRTTVLRGNREGSGCISGEVLRLAAADGSDLLLVMGTGPAAHHKPYYELLFVERAGGWQPVSTRRFFYDVATWEGLEWPILHVATALLAMIVAVAVLATLAISRTLARRLEKRLVARQQSA